MQLEIVPGILEKEWSEIERKLEILRPFSKSVHVDIIDGKFVDNLTFLDPAPFKKYADVFTLELHMMVNNPIEYLKPWGEVGFKRFIGHVEKMNDPIEFITAAKRFGETGLAIDGPTSLDVLETLNLNNLDSILIMTIKAGLSGQEFQPELLEKVREIRKKYPYLPIEVDGGINAQTLPLAKDAGATRFAVTSFIFNSQNPLEAFRSLQHKIE